MGRKNDLGNPPSSETSMLPNRTSLGLQEQALQEGVLS